MKAIDMEQRRKLCGAVSRRGLLRGAAALATAGAATLGAEDDDKGHGAGGTALAYFGCYTPNGKGIYLFSANLGNGTLTPINVFTGPGTTSPSWIALDPKHSYLYAVNETSPGTVSAFKIDKTTGNLTFLNTVGSLGNGPAHMSIDPSGKFALVANYGSGNIGVIRLNPDAQPQPQE